MKDPTACQIDEAPLSQPGLAELRVVLAKACGAEPDWPAKVAAAIYAGIEFAAADPGRALSLLAPGDAQIPSDAVVQWLNETLRRVIPLTDGQAASGAGTVQGIAMIVHDHLRAERLDQLRALSPALVQFALQPYLGFAEAKRWSAGEPA